mmetsp:Transcript_4625/g.7024  ORF Transcript_4625/g.7024 Transcript_4625/m.7024 type:complete len:331 (+) Transcript_4625:84-1076(+)
MEDLLSQWKKVQHEIASKTHVPPDDNHSFRGYFNDNREYGCLYPSIQDKLIGGVDVSFGEGDLAVAVYVITQNHKVVYRDSIEYSITQPYISSFLAFREIDPLKQLVLNQKTKNPELTPEVILVDGNGKLHERGAGIACFLGVLTEIPTIGVGKTLYCMDGFSVDMVEEKVSTKLAEFAEFCGTLAHDLDGNGSEEEIPIIKCKSVIDAAKEREIDISGRKHDTKKEMNSLVKALSNHCDGLAIELKGDSGSVLAAALVGHGGKIQGRRKAAGTKNPIYISVGHDISLQDAVAMCGALSLARIPEPVRQADLLGRDIIRQMKTASSQRKV